MARKSSKTAHVLHLLSKNVEGEAVESNTEQPTISIINQSNGETDVVSLAIQEQLIEEEKKSNQTQKKGTSNIPNIHTKPSVEPTPNILREEPPTPLVQEQFVTLNIMKHMAQKKLNSYMEKFRMCTCERCKKDTLALALSNLPVKYKVIPNAHLKPTLQYYEKKYDSDIAVALTKACIVVKVHPNHEDH